MGKVYDYLQKQLKSDEYRKDAEDCLKIYNKLKEINNGSVWSLQWEQLVNTHFKGFPSNDRRYKPSKIGYVFLKGIEENKEEREEGVFYISVRMAIMSHLSDAQELLSMGMSEEANKRINFVKRLLIKFKDNINQEVSEDELDKIYGELK